VAKNAAAADPKPGRSGRSSKGRISPRACKQLHLGPVEGMVSLAIPAILNPQDLSNRDKNTLRSGHYITRCDLITETGQTRLCAVIAGDSS